MASSSSNNTNLMQGLDSKSRALISKIVAHLKSQGNFDELRKDCLEELDKMESFRQLNQRVESYVATFLSKQEWSDSLSKNQMRVNLRKHVCSSETLQTGAQRLVSQVIEKRSRAFQTRLEGIVQDFIYRDQERGKQERRSRYQNRNSYHQDPSKSDPEKLLNSEKITTITKVNDIISQIEHSEAETATKSDSCLVTKAEPVTASPQTKSDVAPKPEIIKLEKKPDMSSPINIESSKSTPPNKSSLTKRLNPTKKLTPRAKVPNTSSPPEKLTETPPKNTHSQLQLGNLSRAECHQKSVHEAELNIELTKTIEMSTQKFDVSNETVAMDTDKFVHGTESESGRSKVDNCNSALDDAIPTIQIIENDTEKESGFLLENKSKQSEKYGDTELEHKEISNNHTNDNVSDGELKDKSLELIEDSSSHESDIDDSISDVSSVHTSDLSSFDGELSSLSESGVEDHEDEKLASKNDSKSKHDSQQKWEETASSFDNSGKFIGHKNLKVNVKESKRGRPRKDQNKSRMRSENESVSRCSQSRSREEKRPKDRTQGRDKSKRQIKKKRCYSPSSENTREVCLPSKRTRVSSRD